MSVYLLPFAEADGKGSVDGCPRCGCSEMESVVSAVHIVEYVVYSAFDAVGEVPALNLMLCGEAPDLESFSVAVGLIVTFA